MSMINVQNLSFCYEGSYDDIFENVSFQLDTDWKLGFTGRNGRGKTTFLKLLMGCFPYQGEISASVDFDYFPYEVDEDTLALYAVEEACGVELWRIKKELSLLGMDEEILYRPFSTMSGGERTRVLLAALFSKENNFLLIDEPTNHLDAQARAALAAYLNAKKGFILVSHDRAFLDGCVDHILSINKTDIEVQKGNFSSWLLNKEQQDEFERGRNEKLKKEVKRLKDAARRNADWSDKVEKTKTGQKVAGLKPDRGHIGHMAAKMNKRAKSIEVRRERAVEDKEGLLKNVEYTGGLFISPLTSRVETLVTLENVGVSYDGAPVFEGLDLEIKRGERLAVTGGNGSGKTTLLKIIAGEECDYTGFVRRASGLAVSYVPQHTGFLKGGMEEYAKSAGVDLSLFMTILRKFDFKRTQFEKDLADLSEGQKKKVLLAASLSSSAHLYIWDEPLNYIDIISRMQIEEAVLKSNVSMVFVEHDVSMVKSIATKRIILK